MALDAATLELTARELKTVLADAKIAKLFEPTRDELVICAPARTPTRCCCRPAAVPPGSA